MIMKLLVQSQESVVYLEIPLLSSIVVSRMGAECRIPLCFVCLQGGCEMKCLLHANVWFVVVTGSFVQSAYHRQPSTHITVLYLGTWYHNKQVS